MKVVLVFCEGPHDVAFLGRVLRASSESFVSYDGTLGQLPEPMATYLLKRERGRAVDNLGKLDIEHAKRAAPPVLWDGLRLVQDGTLLLLFSCFGQDRHKDVSQFIHGLRVLLSDLRERGEPIGVDRMASVFVYDADDVGVQEKLDLWRRRYEKQFPGLGAPTSGSCVVWKDEEVAWYVFRCPGIQTGQLEDIVLPLLQTAASPLHDAARMLVDEHWPEGKTVTKKRKAAITVAGQMNHPGDSLAVILASTTHLTVEALASDPTCLEIVRFFTEVCALNAIHP